LICICLSSNIGCYIYINCGCKSVQFDSCSRPDVWCQMKYVIFNFLLFGIIPIYGQGSLTLSVPAIYNKVNVTNNWSPPTAINRKNQFDGTSVGFGVNLNYSFRPSFFTRNKHILLNIGAGYFQEQFDIQRPFDYNSPIYLIFYTERYSYHCWQLSGGITYNYQINKNYFLSGNLSYSWLRSFRQYYTPTYNAGFGDFTQTNNYQIDFGNMLNFSVGISKNLGKRISLGLSVLVPVYIRWRNDKIFGDDPSTFYGPNFSLGSNISITYRLKTEHQL